jgi:hypothetical protein
MFSLTQSTRSSKLLLSGQRETICQTFLSLEREAIVIVNRVFQSLLIVALLLMIPAAALAEGVPAFEFATPLFGLAAAPDGSLLVADSGAGVVELRKGAGQLIC